MNFEQYPDTWYRRVAQQHGIPEMFVEDAIQEMKLAVWQRRSARYAAVDFTRKYGRHERYGNERPVSISLSKIDISNNETHWIDTFLDVQVQFAKLPRQLKRVITAHLKGYKDIEIAKKMNVSPRWVGILKTQGLEALRG